MSGLTIPYDVADRIAVAVLKDHFSFLEEELKNNRENGAWLHPYDIIKSEKELLPALRTLIEYFGETI